VRARTGSSVSPSNADASRSTSHCFKNDVSYLSKWTPNEDIFLRRFVIVPQSPARRPNIIGDTGRLVHLAEPGDQGLFEMSMTTLADGRVWLCERESGDATNLNNLVYRIAGNKNAGPNSRRGQLNRIAQGWAERWRSYASSPIGRHVGSTHEISDTLH
jgi:hypothetical protein